ncbi:MAG: hypothetical protein BZY81_01655 [SAR202 cluster bacterium Io17-Chloro-G4]|nr:MAG: hypothetical protein BZY81_01655 [SAR202 cluster bacterium Io17-Chloro-G4]
MPEKYKDEIEEILKRAGEAVPSQTTGEPEGHPEDRPRGRGPRDVRDSLPSRQASAPRSRPSSGFPSITPGKLMLAGVILLIVGIKFWPLIWVGLAILAGGYMMYFVAPRTISHEKRWRGRSMEEDINPRSQWERLKRWIKN